MSKVIGVITARMASTRLPGKVLQDLGGRSVFAHHVLRMQAVEGLDGVFVATSDDPGNAPLIAEAEGLGCGWYAGAEQDIVARHVGLCEREGADAFIRVTCDSPIFDIESTSRFVASYRERARDYIYVDNMTMIQGTLTELVGAEAMRRVHEHYRGAAITQHIKEHMDEFDCLAMQVDADLVRPEYRLTIDEAIDIEMIRRIYEALYRGEPLDLHEVYTWLDDNPEVGRMNMHVGVKGCETLSANLTERPLYSVVPSGRGHVVLDDMKRRVEPREFARRLAELFPELAEPSEED